jgi:hypothetical protein
MTAASDLDATEHHAPRTTTRCAGQTAAPTRHGACSWMRPDLAVSTEPDDHDAPDRTPTRAAVREDQPAGEP